MRRDATGKFTSNWDLETKRRVSVTLTNTAWRLLEEKAQEYGISRSEVIERTARSFSTVEAQNAPWVQQRQQISLPAEPLLQAVVQELDTVQEPGTLQHKQHFLEKLLEMSPGLLYLFDVIEQRNVYINARSLDLLGYAPEIVMAMGADFMAQRMHPDDLAQMPAHYERLATMTDGSFLEMEYRMRHINGEWRWFISRDTVFSRTADGKVHQILGTAQDITERKRTEASLQESHELFQSFMKHSPIAAFIKDEAGRYLYANPWVERVYQRSQADLIGKTDFELLPSTIAEQFRTNDLAVLTSGQPMQRLETIHHQDGEHSYMSFKFPFRNATGQQVLAGVAIDVSERIQAEAALKQREAELHLITNALPVLISFVDADQRYRFVNQQYEEWFGHPISEIYSRYLWEVLGEPAYETIQPYVEQVLAGHQVTFESQVPYKDAGTRFVSITYIPRFGDGGTVEGFVAFVSDITRRKQAEETLRQSEERLRIAQQAANAGVWDWDIRTNQVSWSKEYYWLYGLDPASIWPSYENWLNSIIEEDRHRVDRAAREALKHRIDLNVEFRVLHPIQGERWLTAIGQTFYDNGGRPIRMTGIALDITDRKRAEAELQQREQEFRTLVENTPDIITRYDRNLRHLYINPSIERALGLPPEQFIGKTAVELGFTDEQTQTWNATVQQVFETGQSCLLEYEYPNPDGELRFYQARFVPELVEGDYIATVVGVVRDTTEYKRAEISLRQSEERLRLAMEAAQMGTWDVDLNTGKAIWSEQHFTMLGYEPVATGEASEAMWSSRIHPDDVERVIQAWQQSRLDHALYHAEYRVIRADNGQIAWIAGLGNFTYDQTGEAIRSIGVVFDITDRKQAEAALAESNQTLQALIQACPLAITGLRADGTVRIWNPAAERIFGWSQEEVLGKFLPAIPDHKRDEFRNNLAVTIQGQGLAGAETQRQRKGNILFDVELWSAPVDEAQAGISCVSVIADITARKRTEAALRLSEERLHGFVAANVIGILFGDLEGGIQEANDEFLRIVGYTREELQAGKLRWINITPPEYLPLDEVAIVEARRRGACTPYEKEYIRKDGTRVPVLVGFGLVLAVREEAVAFVLDLSDRKQAEESLRQSEERLRLALLVGKSGIWDWDIVNNHITWSEQIYQFHGLTPATFGGKVEDFAKLIHPEDRAKVSEAIRQALEERAGYNIEFRAVQPTGAIRWLSTTGGAIFDQQGQPVRMLGATTDITERKAIEAEREQLLRREQAAREQAEAANRVKDEFLAVLSHELRTPLNPILGWTKLLRSRQFDPQSADRALETIERNAKLQAQLIEDLLDISRILQGKTGLNVCPVNLSTVVEAALETVRLSAEAKGIQIRTILDSDVGQVNGDANRLQQVLWNLFSNAIKFTPSGGRVEVKLERYEFSVLSSQFKAATQNSKLKTQNLQSYAQITVTDTGQGISPDFLPYVFEYFRQADSSTTRQFGGLGLGLAIVRHLVELHGGTVKAESPGRGMGATFTVQLPLMLSALAPDLEDLPTQETKNLNGICILIVDDEADMRDLLRFILEEQGARVIVAASAVEALQRFSESVPDILVSDIGMPDMDGYALMRQIRTMPSEQGKTIQAIALTAYAGEFDQRQALSVGFQKHIAKPVEPEVLVKAIVEVVTQRQT